RETLLQDLGGNGHHVEEVGEVERVAQGHQKLRQEIRLRPVEIVDEDDQRPLAQCGLGASEEASVTGGRGALGAALHYIPERRIGNSCFPVDASAADAGKLCADPVGSRKPPSAPESKLARHLTQQLTPKLLGGDGHPGKDPGRSVALGTKLL